MYIRTFGDITPFLNGIDAKISTGIAAKQSTPEGSYLSLIANKSSKLRRNCVEINSVNS